LISNNIVYVAAIQYKCTVRIELERRDKRQSSDGMKQGLRIELSGETSWLVRTETLSRMSEKQERQTELKIGKASGWKNMLVQFEALRVMLLRIQIICDVTLSVNKWFLVL
jgi:hypothetical protein